jgi:hypothetical protein
MIDIKSFLHRLLPTIFVSFKYNFPDLYEDVDIDEIPDDHEESRNKTGLKEIYSYVSNINNRFHITNLFIIILYICAPIVLLSISSGVYSITISTIINGGLIGLSILALHSAKVKTDNKTVDHMMFTFGLLIHFTITSTIIIFYYPLLGLTYILLGIILFIISLYNVYRTV